MNDLTSRLRLPDFRAGSVWLVGAGPGDPGLLTLHALHALDSADVVLHDALVPEAILALVPARVRLECVGKRAGRPSMPQLRINARLVELAQQGRRVVRLKGGDPFVFGRGGEEALALAAAGVPFRIVPGITAAAGAAAGAGVPLTHRSVARSVTFATGHTMRATEDGPDWGALAGSDTLALYMAVGRIGEVTAALRAAGRPADEPVALVADATLPTQQVYRATLTTAAAVAERIAQGAATIVIVGAVVGLRDALLPQLETAPASGTRPTDVLETA